jgi:2-hydroxychromene-2-carboxylate isomerase
VLAELPAPAEWRPVLASALPGAGTGDRAPWGERSRELLARRAAELGLQPLRWPQPFPFDSTMAMHVATYAKQIGRTVPFAQAAFRQAYAGGRSLADEDSVLIAAAACEMHPAAVLAGGRTRTVARELRRATEQAATSGVEGVPAVLVTASRSDREPGPGAPPAGSIVFHGERALADVAAYMASAAGAAGAPSEEDRDGRRS